jgi:hypothetical protein
MVYCYHDWNVANHSFLCENMRRRRPTTTNIITKLHTAHVNKGQTETDRSSKTTQILSLTLLNLLNLEIASMESSSSSSVLRGSNRYTRMQELGEGRFGVVFQAKCRVTGLTFAIKRMKSAQAEGVDVTAIRELKCLRELKCPNIISLVDVYSADGLLHMVLELCEATLDDVRPIQTTPFLFLYTFAQRPCL